MKNRLFASALLMVLALCGCAMHAQPGPSTRVPILHSKWKSDRTSSQAREFATIQGPEIAIKAVAIPTEGLSLSEAIINWQRSQLVEIPRNMSAVSTSAGRSEDTVAENSMRVQSLLGRQTDDQMDNLPVNAQTIELLSHELTILLDEADSNNIGLFARNGLLEYLSANSVRHNDLHKILEALSVVLPEAHPLFDLREKAIVSFEIKNWEQFSRLVLELRSIPLFSNSVPEDITAAKLEFYAASSTSAKEFLNALASEKDYKGLFKDVENFLNVFGNSEATVEEKEQARTNALKGLEYLDFAKSPFKIWLMRGLAFKSASDRDVRMILVQMANRKLEVAIETEKKAMSGKGIYSPEYALGTLQNHRLDSRVVLLSKKDGTNILLPMPAVLVSNLGGIQLEHGDVITISEWNRISLGDSEKKYSMRDVLHHKREDIGEWDNLAVLDTNLFGRYTQVYLPIADTAAVPLSLEFVPEDAAYSFTNSATLPILIRSRMILDRRMRGS